MKYIIISILILLVSITSFAIELNEKTIISEDLEITRISEKCYVYVSYMQSEKWGKVPCNGLVYINQGKAIIADTPVDNDQTKILINWVQKELNVEIIGFIGTHWHNDCSGGFDAATKAGISTYTCDLTNNILIDKELSLPKYHFTDSTNISIGNQIVQCSYLGEGHTVDNIVVWIPEEKVLFGGCMVKSLGSTGLGYTDEADLEAWPKTLQKVLDKYKEAKFVIPGHGAYGDTELLKHSISLFNKK